ncbi:(+)-neomenthol dehydrogenase-like [Coffea arabica]|uniref:Short-chain dehydrogenase/reductase n=1 Tax=Coffea arabica TaxID=13443 RepID=A0A6P6T874_COFAR|nr:(+)-neomenthol dehydrogenase-like [Coffea arabica]
MEEATNGNSLAQKRYAVVTGANKGIGLGICKQLASHGITVVLTARDESRGLDALHQLKETGGLSGYLLFHKLDVTDSSSVDSLAEFIKTQFGRLDILVNNAGIAGAIEDVDALRAALEAGGLTDFKAFCTETYDLSVACLETNYYGPKRMVEAFLPLLQSSQSPRIVNVSSILGKLQFTPNAWAKGILSDADNLTEERVDEVLNEYLKVFKAGTHDAQGWPMAYTISKASLNAYTRILAKKWPSVKVNCVCPGHVKTDLGHDFGALTVEEGAESPVRLALLPDDGPSGLFFSRKEAIFYE